MSLVTVKCLCGNKLEKDLKGEGTLSCGVCLRIYNRVYDAKEETYKIKLDKN